MSDPDLVIGIDVAAARPSTAAAVRMGRVAARGGRGGTAAPATVVEWMEADHRDPDQVAALMAWIERHDPAVVAVDALQDYRRQGRRASASRAPASGTPVARKSAAPADPPLPPQRACDRELMARRIRLHPVPSRRAVVSGRSLLPSEAPDSDDADDAGLRDRRPGGVACRVPLAACRHLQLLASDRSATHPMRSPRTPAGLETALAGCLEPRCTLAAIDHEGPKAGDCAMMEISFGDGLKVSAKFDGLSVETDQPVTSGGDGSAAGPYDLFLASLGTCAGYFALRFMRQRGIDPRGAGLTLSTENDGKTGLATTVQIDLTLPPGFPEKYRQAIVMAMDQCKVKRQLEQPPTVVASAS